MRFTDNIVDTTFHNFLPIIIEVINGEKLITINFRPLISPLFSSNAKINSTICIVNYDLMINTGSTPSSLIVPYEKYLVRYEIVTKFPYRNFTTRVCFTHYTESVN